ncbi:Uncharacterised protein [Streptococcus pneumoniae]|nr:Uncharacterised protein [Streptococcus pneumoniae]
MDSNATASPTPSTTGESRAAPAVATPTGSATRDPAAVARASPCTPGRWVPARRESRMYPAQHAAAASASATPTGSSPAPPIPPSALNPSRPSTPIPASARAAHAADRHDGRAATDSVSGPSTSNVTATPCGIRANAS